MLLVLLLQTYTPFVNILLSAGLAIVVGVVGVVGWLLNRTSAPSMPP